MRDGQLELMLHRSLLPFSFAFASSSLSSIFCLFVMLTMIIIANLYKQNSRITNIRFFLMSRRLIRDDSRGVGEALNETVCISKKCRGLTVRAN